MLSRNSKEKSTRRVHAFEKKSPSQEENALEGIHASVDFLLSALAEDLDSPVPSKEPAFLHVANDRVCLVRSLVERLESARQFLVNVKENYGPEK